MPIGQPNPRFLGYRNFGQGTPKTVSITESSTVLLVANPNRLYAQVNNNGGSRIWLGQDQDAVLGVGQSVAPRSMFNFENNGLFLGEITAVSEDGTVNAYVIEGV